jgi:hypothetical protein
MDLEEDPFARLFMRPGAVRVRFAGDGPEAAAAAEEATGVRRSRRSRGSRGNSSSEEGGEVDSGSEDGDDERPCYVS